MAKIKFIYFDLGGVVFIFRNGLRKLAKEEDKNYEDFERVWRQYDDQICRGEITGQDLWYLYKDELGLNEREGFDFLDFWTDNFKPINETHNFINQYIGKISIGLISNIYLGVFEKAIVKGHIPNVQYHSIVQSSQVGFVKPEKEIYQIAQDKSGVKPSEILMVDDKIDFLQPANELGWKTLQFDEADPSASLDEVKKYLNIN